MFLFSGKLQKFTSHFHFFPPFEINHLKNNNSRSYRLTTCRARCITHQGQLISTTGQHNHPAHVKNSVSTSISSTSLLSSNTKLDDNANTTQQTFVQPMSSNQIQAMTPASTMINQQQQQQQMNANYGNNFSMSNILGAASALSDCIDPHTLLLHASNAAANIMSNIQITPIINTSIDDLQILQSGTNSNDNDDISVLHDTTNHMHNIVISSANN
jgi:hypothetical protein